MIEQATVLLPHADRDTNPPVSIYFVHLSSLSLGAGQARLAALREAPRRVSRPAHPSAPEPTPTSRRRPGRAAPLPVPPCTPCTVCRSWPKRLPPACAWGSTSSRC